MAVDREKAIQQLSEVKVKGNDDGLIPAFGVLVQFMPASLWNAFTEKMLMVAEQHPEKRQEIEDGLELAAAECGYHTGWGIINSNEFKSIIGPMIEKEPEDILYGAFAVLAGWGWGDAEITELSPGHRMTVEVHNYYESEVSKTFKTTRPLAFMLRGICRAFMDIAYGAPYPNGLGTFTCEQTKAKELGDRVGEFVVTRK
jgi:hypothetical protein